VRGIVVPNGAVLSRKQVDEIEAEAKSAGAAGLVRLKRSGPALEGPAAKFLGAGAAEALEIPEGALGLYVAGPDRITSAALDRVRQLLAALLHLIPEGRHDFLWVLDFPLFERDAVTGRLGSVHHPFTAPHPEDVQLLHSSPDRVRALAYDVVMDGLELGGGSIRISDPALQSSVFSLLGIDEATAHTRFGFLLEGLRAGAPPHGGIAFGFDRISMVLASASSLRDVIAFPKTTAARALFEGAPSPLGDDDLRELHISVEGGEAMEAER
jgi:aspartyl-tRNA synthetase